MPKVVREGDELSTGHSCVGTTTIDKSNQITENVYAHDILINVKGAPTVGHPYPPMPPCAPHTAELNEGSATVFINNIEVGRHNDSADSGAMLEPPEVTVYAGPE